MNSTPRHDIALGWLIVRRRSLVAGREKLVEQANQSRTPSKWAEQLAAKNEQIANIDDSTDVLLRDGGYLAAAAAIDDGATVTGTIVEDDAAPETCIYCGKLISVVASIPCQPSPDDSHWRSTEAFEKYHAEDDGEPNT